MYYLETKGNLITKTPSWSTKCIFFVHFDYQKISIYAYYCYNSGAISSLGVKFNEITWYLHMHSLVDAFQISLCLSLCLSVSLCVSLCLSLSIYIYIENDLNCLKIKRCNCLKCYNFLKMLQFQCCNLHVTIVDAPWWSAP